MIDKSLEGRVRSIEKQLELQKWMSREVDPCFLSLDPSIPESIYYEIDDQLREAFRTVFFHNFASFIYDLDFISRDKKATIIHHIISRSNFHVYGFDIFIKPFRDFSTKIKSQNDKEKDKNK